jgi:hypothetical protein
MQARILAITGFLILAISGCSNKQSDQNATADPGQPQHVWKEQVKALDKAKNLEDDINAAFEKRAEEIDREAR